ncbi:efflux RND transporter periplasmic adaptor subunit [candidate division KSB1 bacterium]
MLKWKLYLVYIASGLMLIFSLQCVQGNAGENSTSETPQVQATINEVLVETVPLSLRTLRSFILLNSTIETESMVDVYPQVTGIVKELNTEEARMVDKDGVLIKIDDRDFKLAEQKAQISFQKTEADLKRVKESFDRNIVSEVEYDNARFTMEEAKVNWEQAKQNLDYTNVVAPIGGVVTERLVNIGDRVQTNTKLFQIVDTSEKIVKVYIPEKEISSVGLGQKTVIISEFLDNLQFEGTIKRISPIVDPNSGTFKVTVDIKDPENKLRPGMFVTVRIITSVHEDVLAVLKDAIVYDGGLPFIFIVRDSIANRILLQEGFSDEQYVETLNDLTENEQVIIMGQSGLKDKSKVRVMSKNPVNK